MAGLAGLLGGYGSDDDEDQQQQDEAPLAGILGAAHSGSLSPTAAATRPQPTGTQPSSSQDQQQQQGASQPPLRILEGPSTNPEPPPEGLSPPMARGELDSNMESEAGEGVLHSALYALPSELRDPPPGEPDPVLQGQLETFLGFLRNGRNVMSELRKDRRWQNPKFLQKTVEFFQLQQYGTNLSDEVWDPRTIPDEDMWPALQQQLEARKRRRGEQVKFQSAGQQLPPAGPGAAAAAAAAAAAVASQPGKAAAGGAPKVVGIDPRAAAAQAQALASSLVAGAKKSKWDK